MTTLAQIFAEAAKQAHPDNGFASMEMAAPFGWPGGKKILKHRIIALIPPHKTYVEPFAGAASVFWSKAPSEVEVLNDVDPDLMRFYRNIGQAAACDTAQVAKDWDSLKARQEKLTPCEFFSAVKCSFGEGMFKRGQALDSHACLSGQPHFHKNLAEYQARLSNTQLYNEDWEQVVWRYDAPDTFFYLDPPYHGTSRGYNYGGDEDQLDRLAKVLPTLKGKWLLSYDDHPEVRAAFQGSHIFQVQTHYTIAAGDNNHVAKELLIANYPIGRRGMEQDSPPDMAVLGPAAWSELHAWANRFAAKVGDSCGCGVFAQDAAKALHDLVSVRLGKKAMYPGTLQKMARVYLEGANMVQGNQAEMGASYTLSDVRWRLPSGGKEEVEGPPVEWPITVGAWLTERGRKALRSLVSRGKVLRFDSYTFPRVFKNGGFAIPTGEPGQQQREELLSLLAGSWTFGVPNAASRVAERLLLSLGQEEAPDIAPLLVSAANRYQFEHFFGRHQPQAESEYMKGIVEMALAGEKTKLARLGWGPGWSGIIDPVSGLARVEQPHQEHGIYPWSKEMEEEMFDEEEDEKPKRKKSARFSQSFLDTILHTAIGAATALAVTKALTPPLADIKEGEKPPPALPPVPAVLAPAYVEGDQANVDLGTLLEEIDAILKKPETMGIMDADTLTIVRA